MAITIEISTLIWSTIALFLWSSRGWTEHWAKDSYWLEHQRTGGCVTKFFSSPFTVRQSKLDRLSPANNFSLVRHLGAYHTLIYYTNIKRLSLTCLHWTRQNIFSVRNVLAYFGWASTCYNIDRWYDKPRVDKDQMNFKSITVSFFDIKNI